jgi:hypothetical protein
VGCVGCVGCVGGVRGVWGGGCQGCVGSGVGVGEGVFLLRSNIPRSALCETLDTYNFITALFRLCNSI